MSDSVSFEVVKESVVNELINRTGYAADFILLDLNPEEDLGLTPSEVREITAAVGRKYGILVPSPDQPCRYPTLRTLIESIADQTAVEGGESYSPAPGLAVALAFVDNCLADGKIEVLEALDREVAAAVKRLEESASGAQPVAGSSAGESNRTAVLDAGPATSSDHPEVTFDGVLHYLVGAFVDRTGYPADMLEPDLDLEADLGIDTVKQVEAFASTRVFFGIPKQESFRLRDYNTLQKMADYLVSAASVTKVPQASEVAECQVVAPAPAPGAVSTREAIMAFLVEALKEKTGYDTDMLQPDLDLELDLGVDTIAQIEAYAVTRQHFGIPKDESFRLRNYPTIDKQVTYLLSQLEGCAKTAPEDVPAETPSLAASQVVVETAAPEVVQSSAAVAGSSDEVMSFLVGALVDRTGYPPEMLEPELDLEADLGIDTVKQVEAYAATRGHFGIAKDENFRLRDYNTIRKMVDYLVGRMAPNQAGMPVIAGEPAAPAVPVAPTAVQPSVGPTFEEIKAFVDRCEKSGDLKSLWTLQAYVRSRLQKEPAAPVVAAPKELVAQRYEVHPVERVTDLDRERLADLKGKCIGITVDPRQVYERLAQRLEAAGARAMPIYTIEQAPPGAVALDWKQPQAVEETLQALCRSASLDGLILLPGICQTPEIGTTDPAVCQAQIDQFVLALYHTGRALYERLESGKTEGWYMVVTAGDGQFGFATDRPQIPLGGAAAGFVKSLKRELPSSRCLALDLDPAGHDRWDEQIWAELVGSDHALEASYRDNRRYILKDVLTQVSELTGTVGIGSHSVVVASGGGRGVVFHTLKALSQLCGATVIATGRTVPPKGDEDWLAIPESGLTGYRLEFIKRYMAAHTGSTPAVAQRTFESEVLHRRELYQNLAEAHRLGVKLEYRVVDLTDAAATREFLADIRHRYGRIDGIVHGATVEESKSLISKSAESTLRTVASKLHIWLNLVNETKSDSLCFFINFGSGSGRFGNQGQTDYAAANSLLAKSHLVYSRMRPDVHCVTVDWPVWLGAGIVQQNADYLKRLTEARMCAVSLEEGTYWFLAETLCTQKSGEVVISDDLTLQKQAVGFERNIEAAVAAGFQGAVRYEI